MKPWRPFINAYFGTFYIQIVQKFESNVQTESLKIRDN